MARIYPVSYTHLDVYKRQSQSGTTLFTLAGLEHDAQQLTGVRVSVLTPGFLPPKFRDRVVQQAEPL